MTFFNDLGGERGTVKSTTYRNYVLALLMVILAFNFLDRLVLGLLLQDIKTELDLSDTQLGFLTGIAFALFYAVMGIPIARWADRGNRVTIIALTALLWSVAVSLCGLATGFAHLLLIRVGVAIGEAGCIPPAHSIIADYFSRAERPRAMARYMLGGSLALTIGYFSAGWLNEIYGWRTTFILVGLPGLALGCLAWLTIREPRRLRGALPTDAEASSVILPPTNDYSVRQVCMALWSNAVYRHVLLGFSVWFLFGYGFLQWTPAFFIRSHGLETGELGAWFAAVYGVAGGLGIYVGGELAARYAANNERVQLGACAFSFVFLAVVKAGVFVAPNHHLAMALLAVGAFGNSLAQGPVYSAIQTLVPSNMRAIAIALVYMFANLIGMGLGPLMVGALSDVLQSFLGDQSLRYSLVLMCPGYLLAAWHLWRASRVMGIATARPFRSVSEDPGSYRMSTKF